MLLLTVANVQHFGGGQGGKEGGREGRMWGESGMSAMVYDTSCDSQMCILAEKSDCEAFEAPALLKAQREKLVTSQTLQTFSEPRR
jgi:hypothetical protein